jgi:hypothetical protein
MSSIFVDNFLKISVCGNYYLLTGTKQFITNAGYADVFIVYAKVDGEKFTTFIVDKDTHGLSLGPEEHKMGIKGSKVLDAIDRIGTHELSVEQVRAYLIPVNEPVKIHPKIDIPVAKPQFEKYDALVNREVAL